MMESYLTLGQHDSSSINSCYDQNDKRSHTSGDVDKGPVLPAR